MIKDVVQGWHICLANDGRTSSHSLSTLSVFGVLVAVLLIFPVSLLLVFMFIFHLCSLVRILSSYSSSFYLIFFSGSPPPPHLRKVKEYRNEEKPFFSDLVLFYRKKTVNCKNKNDCCTCYFNLKYTCNGCISIFIQQVGKLLSFG